MSYDIVVHRVACEHCKRGPDRQPIMDPTYNLSRIFTLAMFGSTEVPEGQSWGLHGLNGRRVVDTVEQLTRAVARIRNPSMRDQFRALEPENRWGTVEDGTVVLERLLEVAKSSHEECVWEIS